MLPPTIDVPIGSLLTALSLVGAFVFAASGALAAARLQQTLVTFAFFALITGVGGGTMRDLLIGAPVFWIHDARPALICLTAALLVYLTPERWWSARALDWLDAIGLAAFAVFGTAKAMSLGIHPFVAVLMGVISACVGGIIRDLLAGVPSILLRREIYVTAGALAAALYALLIYFAVPAPVASVIAALAGFALRALAIVRGLGLPVYNGRKTSTDQAGGPSE